MNIFISQNEIINEKYAEIKKKTSVSRQLVHK